VYIMRSPSRRNPRYRDIDPPDDADLGMIAAKVEYIGSPEHKRAPSFAGPPSPRPDASICDSRFLDMQDELTRWLRDAIQRGAVSAHFEGGYPRYAWFKDGDVVYEARLVNRGKGTYKGYPLETDEWPNGIDDVYG
jgi:hypothetical protein